MTEMFGEAWPPMSVPDLAPDDDDDDDFLCHQIRRSLKGKVADRIKEEQCVQLFFSLLSNPL